MSLMHRSSLRHGAPFLFVMAAGMLALGMQSVALAKHTPSSAQDPYAEGTPYEEPEVAPPAGGMGDEYPIMNAPGVDLSDHEQRSSSGSSMDTRGTATRQPVSLFWRLLIWMASQRLH